MLLLVQRGSLFKPQQVEYRLILRGGTAPQHSVYLKRWEGTQGISHNKSSLLVLTYLNVSESLSI